MKRKCKAGSGQLLLSNATGATAKATVVSRLDHFEKQREVEQRYIQHFNIGKKETVD